MLHSSLADVAHWAQLGEVEDMEAALTHYTQQREANVDVDGDTDLNNSLEAAIVRAGFYGHLSVVAALVERWGANSPVTLHKALHAACEGGRETVAMYLMEAGAVPCFQRADVVCDDEAVVAVDAAAGACDMTQQGLRQRRSCLWSAMLANLSSSRLVRLLLANNADIKQMPQQGHGERALLSSVKGRSTNITTSEGIADASSTPSDGTILKSLLHRCELGNITALLEFGAHAPFPTTLLMGHRQPAGGQQQAPAERPPLASWVTSMGDFYVAKALQLLLDCGADVTRACVFSRDADLPLPDLVSLLRGAGYLWTLRVLQSNVAAMPR